MLKKLYNWFDKRLFEIGIIMFWESEIKPPYTYNSHSLPSTLGFKLRKLVGKIIFDEKTRTARKWFMPIYKRTPAYEREQLSHQVLTIHLCQYTKERQHMRESNYRIKY